TTTCCCADSSAPPVRVSAPPASTTAEMSSMPWATTVPVSVVAPKFRIWPTAPLAATTWLPAANRAVLAPPGGVVGGVAPVLQLAGVEKSSSVPLAPVHSKVAAPALSTEIVADPDRADESVTVMSILGLAPAPAEYIKVFSSV